MTLITRLRTKNWTIVAGDNQVNTIWNHPKRNNGIIVTTKKLFKADHVIGGLAGFLGERVKGFNVIDILEDNNSIEEITQMDIPEEYKKERFIALASELTKGEIINRVVYFSNGRFNISEIEHQENLYNLRTIALFFKDTRDNFELLQNIKDCFDNKLYKSHLDFNNFYENGEVISSSTIYTLFHYMAYQIYGCSSIEGLIKDSDENIARFLQDFYDYIDGIFGPNKDREEVWLRNCPYLRTIGRCEHIVKLDLSGSAWIIGS